MLNTKQAVALAASAVLPIAAGALFLGTAPSADADATCNARHQVGCWNPYTNVCQSVGSTYFNTAANTTFKCVIYSGTPQWS